MSGSADFAILAPVPLEHLESGKPICEETGFIAFGSMKWELFRLVDEMRGGLPVLMLIYPSHEDGPVKNSFIVSWGGSYMGYVESRGGRHPLGMKHRPPTTSQYAGDSTWAIYWHLEGLFEIPNHQRMPISAVQTIKGGWRKDAPPRGPELVAVPSTIDYPA